MSAGSQRFARDISRAIAKIGVTCKVYSGGHTTLSDSNVVPDAVSLTGSATVFIDKSPEAQDQATALGIYGDLAAHAYFRQEDASLMGDRRVLEDNLGNAWLMHSIPLSQAIPNTVGVSCLLTALKVRPSGMP